MTTLPKILRLSDESENGIESRPQGEPFSGHVQLAEPFHAFEHHLRSPQILLAGAFSLACNHKSVIVYYATLPSS